MKHTLLSILPVGNVGEQATIQARNFAVTKRVTHKRSKRIIVNDIDFAKPVKKAD